MDPALRRSRESGKLPTIDMSMHVDVQRLETGPGGPDRLLVRAHGRVVATHDGRPGVVIRVDGRSYAVIPVEDDAPVRGPDEGELTSAALVLPQQLLDALQALGHPQSRGRRGRRPAPSAADLTKLARSMEDEHDR
jgi:hypothetical protein